MTQTPRTIVVTLTLETNEDLKDLSSLDWWQEQLCRRFMGRPVTVVHAITARRGEP